MGIGERLKLVKHPETGVWFPFNWYYKYGVLTPPPGLYVRRSPLILPSDHRARRGRGRPHNLVKSITGGVAGGGLPNGFYTTNFVGSESPISESGAWLNGQTDGTDWQDCAKGGGRGYGLQTASGALFKDSSACLKGTWSAIHEAVGTVSFTIAEALADTCSCEVEIFLQRRISPGVNSGYELTWRVGTDVDSYHALVRWNGPLGNFTPIFSEFGTASFGVDPADTVRGTVSKSGGNTTVTAYKNSIAVPGMTVTEATTLADGAPGMGFFLHPEIGGCDGSQPTFGFSSYTAQNT